MDKEVLIAFLKQRIEQVAVGVVALLIIIYLLFVAVTESRPERILKETDAQMVRLEEAKRRATLPDEVVVNYEKEFRGEIEKKMNPVDGAEWFVYKRPFVPLNFSVKPPEEAELYPPQLSATLEGIKVKLSWTDSGENKNVRILVYKLLRKGEDDKQFKLLRELLLPQKEYTDEDTEPGAEYTYKLVTTAELDPEKRFIKWKVPLVETKTATVESEEKKIETPFPYAIRLKWRMPTTGKFRFDVEPTLGEGKKAEQELAIGEELFIKDKDGKDKGIGYKLSDKTPKEQDDYVIIEHIKSGRKWRVDRAKGIGSPPPPTRLKE